MEIYSTAEIKINLPKIPVKPSCVYLGTKIDSENYKTISDVCKINNIPCHQMFMRADKFCVKPSICYS